MPNIQNTLNEGYSLLKNNDIENYKNECLIILEHILNKNQAFLYTHNDYELTKDEYNKFLSIIKERCSKKPLQYILGYQEFMGLNFKVSPDVLIPRQDTETLVESIISRAPTDKKIFILDIGTGSGCISISLAKFIKNAIVISVDISENALKMAYSNASLNNVLDRVFFLKSDIFSGIEALCANSLDYFEREISNLDDVLANKFDIIVSNPPYIPLDEMKTLDTGVVNFEPNLALYGGIDGLDFYREITLKSTDFLKNDGILAFEVGYNQAEAVRDLMAVSYEKIEIIKDYNDINRIVMGSLREGKKLGNNGI